MHGPMLAAAVFAAALCCGLSVAGEDDIMLMRGDSGDGKTRVNIFQASRHPAAWMGYAVDEAAAESPAPRGMARGDGFLQWKNSCVTKTPVVGGQPVDLRPPHGYEQVSPYILKPATEGGGYRELLAEEIEEGEK